MLNGARMGGTGERTRLGKLLPEIIVHRDGKVLTECRGENRQPKGLGAGESGLQSFDPATRLWKIIILVGGVW